MPRDAVKCEYAPDMDKPVMRIGAVADLLGVCVRTVRIYEERGLVRPARKNNQRLYSFNDVRWLGRLRELISRENYDLDEVERLISLPACWQLKDCSEQARADCQVADSPGKQCWVLAKRAGELAKCQGCQLYRLSATGA